MHMEGRYGESTQLLHLTLTAETLIQWKGSRWGLCTVGRELVEGKQQAPRSERSAQEDSEPAGHCTTAQGDHHDPESCGTGRAASSSQSCFLRLQRHKGHWAHSLASTRMGELGMDWEETEAS